MDDGERRLDAEQPSRTSRVAVASSGESRSRLPRRIRAAHLDLRAARAAPARRIVASDAVERRGVRAARHRAERQRRRPSVAATVRLVLVSTTPGRLGRHRDDAGRDRRDEVERASRRLRVGERRRRSAGAIASASPSSVPAYCADDRRELGLGRRRGRRRFAAGGTATTACGVARDRVPAHASVEAPRRNGARSNAAASTRPSALIAFTRPRAMSPPECPPFAPESVDPQQRRDPSATARRGEREPQERVIAPRAPDRERVVARPVEVDEHAGPRRATASSAFAPSRPCSSDTVKRSSSGPCATRVVVRDGHRRRDADAVVGAERRSVGAHPVAVDDERRSAPRAGRTGSPDRARRPCPGAPGGRRSARCSRPADAGTRTTTFPSVVDRRLQRSRARPRRGRARAPAPPAFDGRAIRVSSTKRSQTSAGSSPASGRAHRRSVSARRPRGAPIPSTRGQRERRPARRRTSRSGR